MPGFILCPWELVSVSLPLCTLNSEMKDDHHMVLFNISTLLQDIENKERNVSRGRGSVHFFLQNSSFEDDFENVGSDQRFRIASME